MNNPTTTTTSRTITTESGSSTLRPRTTRLLSGLDGEGPDTAAQSSAVRVSASPFDSPFGSRSASPAIPNRHPSRTSPADRPRPAAGTPLKPPSSSSLLGSFGGSWTALQGLASNVLGSEAAGSTSGVAVGKSKAAVVPGGRARSSSGSPANWGVSSSAASMIAAGSKEDRGSRVREAKRKDLLRANADSDLPYHDASRRYKRRTSDDASLSGALATTEEEQGDALVYVHNVLPSDTMAGVALKYSCQVPIIRKANRMWPNDTIQVRKTIVLPVDACGIKGTPCSGPNAREDEDLLGDESEALTMHDSPSATSSSSALNGWHRTSEPESTQPDAPSSTSSQTADEPPWRHESWVKLPGFPSAVEIARLPRKNLGYFSRSRRKSNPLSELGTPKTSLDFSHGATSPASTPKAMRTSPRPSQSTSRPRASSHALAAALHGPGGVGALDHTTRTPGPASDALTRLLAPHLPSVEPPPHQTVYTPWLTDPAAAAAAPSFNGYRQRAGAVAASPAGADWADVGGAIEAWIRRTARRAATALDGSGAASSSAATTARAKDAAAAPDLGDLIELVDSVEVGDGGAAERHAAPVAGASRARGDDGWAAAGLRGRSRGRSWEKGGKVD